MSHLRRTLVIAGIGVAVLGGAAAAAYRALHRTHAEPERLVIEARAPGFHAEEMERSITAPIERSLSDVPGLVDLESVSGQGISVVRLGAGPDTPLPILREAVIARLADIERTLPSEVGPPVIATRARGDARLHYTVEARAMDAMELRALNEWDIREALERIPGVARITTCGGLVKRLEIVPDPARMNALGVSLPLVADAIVAARPGGAAVQSQLTSLEDASGLQISASQGIPIRIRDLAQVRIGHAPRTCTATRDGKEDLVEGIIDLQAGEDASRVLPRIADKVAELTERVLPRDVQIRPFDFSLASVGASKGRAPSLRVHIHLSSPAEVSLPMIAEAVRRTAEVTDLLIQKGEIPGDDAFAHIGGLELLVALDSKGGRPLRAVASEIADSLAKLPGLRYDFSTTVAELPPALHAITLRLSGVDLDALHSAAGRAVSALLAVRGASAAGVADEDEEPGVEVVVDRRRLADLGIRAQDVHLAIEAAMGGHYVGTFREGTRRFDVVVRLPSSGAGEAADLERLVIPLNDRPPVPLSQVLRLEARASPAVIRRRRGARFVEVALDVRGRDPGDFLEEARRRVAEQVELPAGVSLSWGEGAAESY